MGQISGGFTVIIPLLYEVFLLFLMKFGNVVSANITYKQQNTFRILLRLIHWCLLQEESTQHP